MIKGIIFDFDGTLIKLPIRYNLIFNKLKEYFETKDEFKPLIPTIIKISKGDETKLKQAFDIICEEELYATLNFEKINGAVEILEHFNGIKIKLGLVTMQCRPATEKLLSKLKIETMFSSVITRNENFDRVGQIQDTCNAFNFLPKEILVIGDRLHDIQSATEVGCNSFLFDPDHKKNYPNIKTISNLLELREAALN